MSIIIVDDNEDQRALLQKQLNKAGYQRVVQADSAAALFELLGLSGGRPSCTDVELVLLDLVMPEIDGLTALGRMKADEDCVDIPVLVVTARREVEALNEALDLGAQDYMTKPVDLVELLARIRAALRLKKEMERRKAREAELLNLNRQLEEANQLLERLSYLDGLTGVPNRRYFDKALAEEWRRAGRAGQPLALIMADIDYFKKYNDFYGHQAGDRCLTEVAAVISRSLKRGGDFVARYGGEEFVVVAPNVDKDGAVVVAENIRRRLAKGALPHEKSPVADRVTLSLGLAVMAPDPEGTPEALIQAADSALYEAKAKGRDRLHLWRSGQ